MSTEPVPQPKHQKLVWPAHKLVCGPGKAHPFAMLPLLDVELEQARQLLHSTLGVGTEADSQKFRAALEELDVVPAEQVLDNASGDVYDARKLQHKPLVLSNDDVDLAIFSEVVASQICAATISVIDAQLCGARAMPVDYAEKVWFSLAQHKLYIIAQLGQLSRCPSTTAEVAAFHKPSKERYNTWFQSGMGTGDPCIARALSGHSMTVEPRQDSV
ncbi:hypothetical protein JCM8208_000406 [Rhodotorula glutinis]